VSLDVLDLSGSMLDNLDDHHLVFWTTPVHTFYLGTYISHDGVMSISPKRAPIKYHIVTKIAKGVGTVLLDGCRSHRLTERHEFILIAEAQYYGLDLEPGNINGYSLYVGSHVG